MSTRVLLTLSAVLLAVSITAASVLSSGVSVSVSPPAEPRVTAPPAPIYVTPAPLAFDLESDNPATAHDL